MERNQMTGLAKQWGGSIRWSVYAKPHKTTLKRRSI